MRIFIESWHDTVQSLFILSLSFSLSLSLLFTMFQCFRQQTKLNHDLRDIFQLMRFRRARYRIQKLYWPMFTFETIRFLRTFHIFFLRDGLSSDIPSFCTFYYRCKKTHNQRK